LRFSSEYDFSAGSLSVRLSAYDAEGAKTECLWSLRDMISHEQPEQTLRRILEAKRPEPFDVAVHRLVHGCQVILGPAFADSRERRR
jgi:hypothetical protein